MNSLFFVCGGNAFLAAFLFSALLLPHLFRGVAAADESDWPRAIEDNSFFIEEAYNQEPGVIQHISNLNYMKESKDWAFTFTEEWPVPRETHQLSFTIPYLTSGGGDESGPGDIMLNYRFQLFGHDDFVTAAPRLSVIFPTGSESGGLGNGVFGMQFNLPVSKRLARDFTAHLNAGFTLFPDAGTEKGAMNLWQYNLGGSVIWLVTETFNIMAEFAANLEYGLDTTRTYIASPGLRYAINFDSAQIVPGFAVPVEFSEGDENVGFFFYLSIEHQAF
ncbi:MAG: transporter [Deltaproteobacteria bacterium]|nr:transporter [Deltaproteobacteria bacterium]